MSLIIAFVGAVGGAVAAGVFRLIEAFIQRRWGKQDKNDEILAEVKALKAEIAKVEDKVDEQAAIEARARILRFGDEVSHGQRHSKDHFQQTLIDIDAYNKYCSAHKNFKNSITELTAEKIKTVYNRCDAKNDFLE